MKGLLDGRRTQGIGWLALLADLLQDLAGRLPGDSLQAEEADGKPLRQQALEGAVQVLEGKHKKF